MKRNRINWFDTRYGIQRAEALSQYTFKPKVNIVHLDRVIKEGKYALTSRPNYAKIEEDKKKNKNKIFGNELPREPMVDVNDVQEDTLKDANITDNKKEGKTSRKTKNKKSSKNKFEFLSNSAASSDSDSDSL